MTEPAHVNVRGKGALEEEGMMGGGGRNFYLFCPISSFLPQNNRQFFPFARKKVKQYKGFSGDFFAFLLPLDFCLAHFFLTARGCLHGIPEEKRN